MCISINEKKSVLSIKNLNKIYSKNSFKSSNNVHALKKFKLRRERRRNFWIIRA